jgi:hypothetical protein
MPKRAERRHHEERVKDKFRRHVRRWLKFVGFSKRGTADERDVDRQAVRRAHHPKHYCQLCKGERYDRTAEGKLHDHDEGSED